MPRRRGEYTLVKSTSFTVFPITNSSDKAFYSANDTGQGTYKAKIRLNVTIAPATVFTNDPYEEDHESSLSSVNELCHQQSMQQKEKTKNGYRRELLQLFFRDFSKDHTLPSEYLCNKNKRQYRATSHDPSFRNSLKYSFEKIKLLTASQKYTKQETKSSGEVVSLVNLMPDMLMTMERNGSSGKNSWRKVRKVHRSKSGALKIIYQI